MLAYWQEFMMVAVAHLLAVISPGPDLMLVIRQSLVAGKATAIASSVGIGLGIMVHVAYSLLGLAVIMHQSAWLFDLVRICGAAYLVYLGLQCLRSAFSSKAANSEPQRTGGTDPSSGSVVGPDSASKPRQPVSRPLWTGFLTNVLNPKATLFFFALFSVVIEPDTPKAIQLAYGIYMSLATMGWFALVSLLLSTSAVRSRFIQSLKWVDAVMGGVLIAFGSRLLFFTEAR
ncbi:MAG: lysine transporter LysE [unclassified Hahellaceae]|nr:lysine transporter LysE [Hahellaceae bacterium]|tara:strand:- start:13479 stop:14171 length:693 start_codon:yes stop_codon:yes gene_type:complete